MAVAGDRPEGIRETAPRPGHADLAGVLKIGSDDTRDILERASARETAARVAAGGVAKAFLRALGVVVSSYVESIGSVAMAAVVRPCGGRSCDRRGERGALPRCRGDRGDEAAHRHRPRRRRVARRRVRGHCDGARARARHLRRGGSQARCAARGGGDVDPGDQGLRDRRRLRRCRAAGQRACTTRSTSRPARASPARPTTPAGSRAA